MKRLLLGSALLALTAAAHASDGWFWFFDAAARKSRETGKPLLIDFSGSDWCKPCALLDRDIYQKPEFKAWAAKNVILLRLDFPKRIAQAPAVAQQNQIIAETLKVVTYPTVVFVRSDGVVLGRSGYFGPAVKVNAWLKGANEILARANKQVPRKRAK